MLHLVGDGYYAQRPDSVRSSYILFGIVTGIILIAGGIWISNHSGMQPLPFIVAGLLTGAIICGFGWFMPARTQAGARALEGVLGFEDFLAHVESDRFNRTIKTPEMFEKFLPFAMALGVEKNWSKAFQGIYTQPPQWYQGSYGPGFYPYMFANDLNSHVLAWQRRHDLRPAQRRRLRLLQRRRRWWRLLRWRLRRRWRRRLLAPASRKHSRHF